MLSYTKGVLHSPRSKLVLESLLETLRKAMQIDVILSLSLAFTFKPNGF